MKLLIELTKIAHREQVSKIDIFDAETIRNKGSKFNEFYEAMLTGKFRSDQDAAQALYQTSASDDRYRQLKSRFRRRLLNTVFFLSANLPARLRYEQAFAECQRDLAMVHILGMYNARYAVTYLARQVLTMALRHHFTSMIITTTRMLMADAVKKEDSREHERMKALWDLYAPIDQAESKAEQIYQAAMLSQLDEVDMASPEQWELWRDQIIHLGEAYASPRLLYLGYKVRAMGAFLLGQADQSRRITRDALDYLAAHPDFYSRDQVIRFRLLQLQCCLVLEDVDTARDLYKRSIAELPSDASDVPLLQDIFFLICLRTAQYDQALALLRQSASDPAAALVNENHNLVWQLYRMALHYLVATTPGMATLQRDPFFSPGHISTFLEETPVFSRDQRILEVWTLLLQLLFQIERKDREAIESILERLKPFVRKHLHPVRHVRAIECIRCLTLLSRGGLQAGNVRFHNKYFDRLQTLPQRYRGQIDQLEILPFHTLWEIIHRRIQLTNFGDNTPTL